MVKFGKYINQNMQHGWEAHYLDYKVLKKQIKHLISVKEQSQQEAPGKMRVYFIKVLNEEVEKVEKFTQTKYQELEVNIALIWREASKLYLDLKDDTKRNKMASKLPQLIQKIQETAKNLGDNMCKVFDFIDINKTAMRKICKKWDKQANDTYLLNWFDLFVKENKSFPSMAEKINSLLVTMSKIYVLLRNIKEKSSATNDDGIEEEKKSSETWTPPESFERETTKYWVRYSDLLRLKLAIIEHLPLLIFGMDANAAININDESNGFMWHESQELLARRESIKETGSLNDSASITSVYFDSNDFYSYDSRLRRREGAELIRVRWYGRDTPKPEEKVFIERKTHHESWVHDASIKERVNLPFNKISDYINNNLNCEKEASGWKKMNAEKKEKQLQLLTETQNSIVKRKLIPQVRSIYSRTAFQLTSTNKVRISIDTDLWLINETSNVTLPNDGSRKDNTKWCLSDQEVNMLQHNALSTGIPNFEQLGSLDAFRFPYAILEVKLQSESPAWLERLLGTHSLVRVHKFSKFLTGSVVSHREKLRVMPHWFEKDGTIDYNARGEFQSSEFTDENSDGTGTETECGKMKNNHMDDKKLKQVMNYVKRNNSDSVVVEMVGINDGGNNDVSKISRNKSTAAAAKTPPPKYVPVKVEPKSFFANERTFIQWLSASLLMLTLGGALVNLGGGVSSPGSILGFTVLGSGLVFAVYSVALFHLRAQKLRERADGPYDDRYGPTILVIVLLVAMITNVILLAQRNGLSTALLEIKDNGGLSCQSLLGGSGGRYATPFFLSFNNAPCGLTLLKDESSSEENLLFTAHSAIYRMKIKNNEDGKIKVTETPKPIFALPTNIVNAKLRGLAVVPTNNTNGTNSQHVNVAYVLNEKPRLSILQINLTAIPANLLSNNDFELGYTPGKLPRAATEYSGGIGLLPSFEETIILSTFDGIVIVQNSNNQLRIIARIEDDIYDDKTKSSHVGAIFSSKQTLYLLMDEAKELVTIDVMSGRIKHRYTLPGNLNEIWSGLHVDEINQFIYMSCTSPTPGIWKFRFTDKDGSGFTKSCD